MSARRTCLTIALVVAAAVTAQGQSAPGGGAAPASTLGTAARPSPRHTLSIRVENDVVAGTDMNYSSGVSLTITGEGEGLLGGFWELFGAARGRWSSGYELGQMIWTPGDVARADPDPRDRPYAGLLFGGLSTHYVHGQAYDGLRLMVGVVGPASLAKQFQNGLHRLAGLPTLKGWAYQLQNEPMVNVVYEHRQRYVLARSDGGGGAAVIPVVGAMLGTAFVQAQGGAQLLIGRNLPDTFGSTQLRGISSLPFPVPRQASQNSGVFVFGGPSVTAVARDISLDGNTFRDSRRVAKKAVVPSGEIGISAWGRSVTFTFSYIARGREFQAQARASHFATLTMDVRF